MKMCIRDRYDDKVLIAFNYKEGTQTITFEEAAQAASRKMVRIWIALLHQGLLHRFCAAVLFIYFIESILQKRHSALRCV